ncbi:uncharacterized protein LOC132386370 isoform X2 [Hypanus sabinus]|uniref:uncharacterized protein LOC132386370 isoform X2 n=1 Tax=Hypanus sabinus TaxID=79690 RepID=UPI0028C4138D|nr:uncharacterized protein LOC132386370 isoform X2 [Hypanus sabinus]
MLPSFSPLSLLFPQPLSFLKTTFCNTLNLSAPRTSSPCSRFLCSSALHPALVGTGLTHLLTQAFSDNGCFPDLSSETQRILGRMDRSERYMNVKLGNTDSRSPSRAEPDVSYAELNFKSRSAPRVRTDREDPNFTYSDLKFRNEEPRIDQHEYPPIASGPGGLSTTTQTAAQEQESKVKIGNRRYRLICLVTSALMVVVVGLSIHVSQIRQSYETCHRNSNLSDLKRMNSDLRHQFNEMETKYRSAKETKTQICELLTSRRGLWAGASCTSCPLERPSADSAEGISCVMVIGRSSARSRHPCSQIFLKRSKVSVNSQ